jgi:CheY-like chemotaxis protein
MADTAGGVRMDLEITDRKEVLLIEDDQDCAAVVGRTLEAMGLLGGLEVCPDCDRALTRLRQAGRDRPGLILLSLEMPQQSAVRFLEGIKADPALQVIPVVMLAAGDKAKDVTSCYGLGVAELKSNVRLRMPLIVSSRA